VQYDTRPKNLELISGNKGKGCYVTEKVKRGMTPSYVIYPHSTLLAINSMNVEKQVFDKIRMQLKTAVLPLRLKLQSPTLPTKQRGDQGKRRRRRKHRSKAVTYTSERFLRQSTKETIVPTHKSDRTPNSRGRRDYRDSKNTKQRRMSTGSWQCLQDAYTARPSYEVYPSLSTIYSTDGQSNNGEPNASYEMKEELNYLRTALERIYAALIITPTENGELEEQIEIPFNKKFVRHFQILELILKCTRLKRDVQRRDPPSKPAATKPRAEDQGFLAERSDLASAVNVDQWLGRIVQELGVNHLNLESRAEECVQSLEAICNLKDATDTMGNQVRSLENLLTFVKRKNVTAMQEIEKFKSKIIDVEQGVEKIVIKIFGIRDRVGSLAKCLVKAQNPRVNRLASELRLTPIQADHVGGRISDLQLINRLGPLTSILDQIMNLIRKSEIVIRDGLSVQHENYFDIGNTV